MKTILLVFGTRPEAIKMVPLVMEFRKYPEEFQTVVCVTAQHREMLDQVLHLFQIQPDFDLNIMKQGQDLYDLTSNILVSMKSILKEVQPNVVLVHGDTATSTAVALASFYQQIPVAHVEAGLRTYDIYSPWPEEMNRQLTSRIATYHFAPTALSKKNLLSENIPDKKILITGNTVIDALHIVVNKLQNERNTSKMVAEKITAHGYDTVRLQQEKKMVLITGHRRENFGDGFYSICKAIKQLATHYPEVDFIYPMHLNPNVRKPIQEIFEDNTPSNLFFIEPLEYLEFIFLMDKSYIVLTDSGGIQEEAPGLGKPVLVMRNTTERPEALEAGTVKLVGTDCDTIIAATAKLLTNIDSYQLMSKANNPYGDGLASSRIVNFFRN